MKKIVVGGVLVLVMGAVSMPFVNGMFMEKGYRQLVEDTNKEYTEAGLDLNIEIVRYDRGFFNSEIETKLHLGELKMSKTIENIVFLEQAKHGYLSVVSKTSLDKNIWYNDFVNNKLDGKNPIDLTTTYMLTGDITSVISMNPLTIKADDETFNSRAGELVITSDWEMKDIKVSGTWDGMNVAAADNMDIAGFSINTELEMLSTYIFDYKGSFNIDKITVQPAIGDHMEINNFNMEQSQKYNEDKNTLAVELSYAIGSIIQGKDKVEEIADASVTFGVKGIDAATYEEAAKLYVTNLSKILKQVAITGDNQEELSKVMEQELGLVGIQMMGLADKFLKSGLEIYISNLHAKIKQDEVDANIMVRLEKDLTSAEIYSVLMATPEKVFEYISLKTDAQMNGELVKDIPPMLTIPSYPGMKTGLFILNGTNLKHKAETRDNKLFINDEEVTIQ
ncbi:MAG: YdgA family protein [Desulfotalea sp.]